MAKRPQPNPLHHSWDVTPAEARQIQEQLRSRVSQKNGPELRNIRYVAGVDCSLRDNLATASIRSIFHFHRSQNLPADGARFRPRSLPRLPFARTDPDGA